jgi:3-oxoacyl-[acyl-carrier protein] reductase
MLIDLRDKVAVVTGGARGIGLELARTFATEGVRVVVTDIRADTLEQVREEFRANGQEGAQFVCDVRDAEQARGVIKQTVARFGRVDILVNNAGVAGGGPVDRMAEEIWRLNVDTNLTGTFHMCQAVIPQMKSQKSGRILNAASFAAVIPAYGGGAYAASKAGVHYLTKVLAGELGPWNITVNCYAPGMVPTEMNHYADLPAERQERLLDTLSLRRWGEAAEIASLLCFLASDRAGYITGALIEISGGKLAIQQPRSAYEAYERESGEE